MSGATPEARDRAARRRTEVRARWEAGATMREIGVQIGISGERVRQLLNQSGVETSPKSPNRQERWLRIGMEKFHANIDDSEGPDACHPWIRQRSAQGYGRLSLNGRVVYAHVLALTESRGLAPIGLVACHTCDNPPCCNPDHLYWGTYRQNYEDAVMNGRRARGWGHKLTAWDVAEIRSFEGLLTQLELARRYNVSQPAIAQIMSRTNWRWM